MINTSALNGEIDLTLTGRDKNFQVVLYTRAREMYFYILYDETKERKKKKKKEKLSAMQPAEFTTHFSCHRRFN